MRLNYAREKENFYGLDSLRNNSPGVFPSLSALGESM